MPTHYSVLGVAQTADVAAISSSYKKLVLKTHPDKGGKAEEFIRVHDAYEVLSNVAARAAYDEELQKRRRAPPPTSRAPPPPPPPADRASRSAFTTPPPRSVPNEYAFRRPRANNNDFNTGSPPPRVRRQRANAFFARDGPGADTRGNEQQQQGRSDDGTTAARRAELDVLKRLSTQAEGFHWLVENWIENLMVCVGADRLRDIMTYVDHFEVKLKQNMDMLALRQMTMTLIIRGGLAANMFPNPPPLDMEETCRAMADLDQAVNSFEYIAQDVTYTADRLRKVQTGEADGARVENNPKYLNGRLRLGLDDMKRLLETVLFQKNCWFEERNRARTNGV